MIEVMDQTALLQAIFIMFNELSDTLQKERPRSHQRNQQLGYHRLKQRTLNDLHITDWSNEH